MGPPVADQDQGHNHSHCVSRAVKITRADRDEYLSCAGKITNNDDDKYLQLQAGNIIIWNKDIDTW